MAVEVRLPQFGMGMLEGTIVTWHKHEGDTVAIDEVIAEVEANKTTEELVAPAGGVLQRILVEEGETVPVYELLAVIAAVGETEPGGAKTPSVPSSALPPPATVPTGTAVAREITPRARRLAKELSVDLDEVIGTGPGGRVTEDDVAAASARSVGGTAVPRSLPGSSEPLTGMRATIAQRMLASLQSSAQYTLVTTADVTDLVAYREGLAEDRPTYTDFVVKAVALALRRHPRLNAALHGEELRVFSDIHVGVATALDDGLVTPVVRNADRKSVHEIAREAAALVQRVRAGAFKVDDVSGSTFTVTSLGGQGIDAFTPILNPPEVAILGVGRIVDHPARDGENVTWRKVTTLSLTVDHRVVDGHPAAAFLGTVADLLGGPDRLDE